MGAHDQPLLADESVESSIRRSTAAVASAVEDDGTGPGRGNGDAASSRARARRRLTIDITGGAVAKLVVGLLALAFIGDLAGKLREVFVWTLAAAFLAIALNPLVERLEP
ncbi:MAG: hypothetical protein QOJ89_5557, partial [bacterium]